ncbi:MAG: hypothetical protein ACKO5R_10785 [Planctomycetaceae bacterium]
MLVAGLGGGLAVRMGFVSESARGDDAAPSRLDFGPREELVDLLADTPPEGIIRAAVARLEGGTTLEDLVAAAALANARACGGEDYVGFHTFMALSPALQMSRELPPERRALPVLKVLHRNARCIHEPSRAGRGDTLVPVAAPPGDRPTAASLRDAVRDRDLARGETLFAGLADGDPATAWNALLPTVHDGVDVHRVVLAHRAYDMLGLVGPGHAGTLLRQSLHYCWKLEEHAAPRFASLRTTLPRLFDEHRLDDLPSVGRTADDAWLGNAAQALATLAPADAAGQVAEWLAAGFDRQGISDALAIAANELVLRDAGRPKEWAQPGKPVGSVHGDSIGVHACDSANAWRHMALAADRHNAAASLLLAAWHLALDWHDSGRPFADWEARPSEEVLRGVTTSAPDALLADLDGAIRSGDQERACALAKRACDLGHPHRGILDRLLAYAVSEDGSLHAEKYYRTATDEHARARPNHRARQVVALARVTASEYGSPAPGVAEACDLLGVVAAG